MDNVFVIISMLGIFGSDGFQVQSMQFFTTGESVFYGDKTHIFASLVECENRLREVILENAQIYSSQEIRVVGGKVMETLKTDDWITVSTCQEIER